MAKSYIHIQFGGARGYTWSNLQYSNIINHCIRQSLMKMKKNFSLWNMIWSIWLDQTNAISQLFGCVCVSGKKQVDCKMRL